MRMLCFLVAASIFSCPSLRAAEAALTDALQKEAQTAIAKGLAWLAANQKPDGVWSDEKNPAMTALPLWALAASGQAQYTSQVDKAVAFILSKAQPDGGIYVPDPQRGGAGLGNYNTSLCMMGLHATGRKDVIRAIQKAREYTAATQLIGADEHAGGFGYDRGGRRHTDLTNTGMALDAMRRTQSVEDLRPSGEKRADLNWDAALKYVENMQQKDGADKGGFLYTKSFAPGGNPNAGGAQRGGQGGGERARPQLRSYGSITYVGLLSMMHTRLTRSDPRVTSALDYCTKHWTLDENPGQGGQGIYFYYNILTRALSAANVEAIPQAAGGSLAWREALIRKVISLQRSDGSWINENNRWWENDPVLVTSYSLLALEFASGMTE
ncbi:MAG TPA: terpene cyclase/mutase family protein [Kiritimatiellia bacterium]|nr:terpene cyclase/mutase family protein [Kiritimatiellia bacterium]HPS08959.1 terpene cyclase/mutase family protein [Kiritimatiellia bacterium]